MFIELTAIEVLEETPGIPWSGLKHEYFKISLNINEIESYSVSDHEGISIVITKSGTEYYIKADYNQLRSKLLYYQFNIQN